MDLNSLYRVYSTYLKNKYGQKVYKLPVNIPCSCPNRTGLKDTRGCIFCGASGSGYELLDPSQTVTNQLDLNSQFIRKKYKANKFIAYYQSFSNTFLNINDFKKYMTEGANYPEVVELSISTRPDCIYEEQLDFLAKLKKEKNVDITIELGLQSSNNKTLEILNRHHSVEDYIKSSKLIHDYGLEVCTHVISDLPWDSNKDILNLSHLLNKTGSEFLKVHSLYVEKNTKLEEMYRNGLELLDSDTFINRTILLLEHINPNMVIERLIGRIPEENSVIANWHQSWWKIRDQLVDKMVLENKYQGKEFKHEF